MMRMAEAPAASAKFALSVKLQIPRCTRMTSPLSYQTERPSITSWWYYLQVLMFSIERIHASNISGTHLGVEFGVNKGWYRRGQENLVSGHTTTLRRICKSKLCLVGMLLLGFQSRAKASTNADKFIHFITPNINWNFHLSNKSKLKLIMWILHER